MDAFYSEKGDPTAIIVDQHLAKKSTQYKCGTPVTLKIPLDALAAANDIVSVENPFGVEVIIIEASIHVKVVGGTATAVIDVDVVADATATGDDIFDGIDANALTLVSMLEAGAGTNAEHTGQVWNIAGGANDFLNAKLLVAAAAALEADLYVVCIPMDA